LGCVALSRRLCGVDVLVSVAPLSLPPASRRRGRIGILTKGIGIHSVAIHAVDRGIFQRNVEVVLSEISGDY